MKAPSARIALASAAIGAVGLAGCDSPSDTTAAPSTGTDPIAVCPSGAPAPGAKPVELAGAAGRAAVIAPTKDSAPRVTVETPYRVDASHATTTQPGSGAELTENSVVTVCYQGVNGRTGRVFDDAFSRATSAEVALPDMIAGFRTALVGQRSGATVVASVTAADAYPKGEPRAGIEPGDTLIYAITVLAAN
ncbi:FKBP-type peptidyl-prolyl cis-trans isomerase [Tsukamurella sp. PLM1]|uniref:FKBP-type peptidyl-prolyl cis-trans isomerase n=1 Tax=Tsukamurella sp. PLM1 TaxID=2929795 RepID=UPI0020495C7B|nr:FKBP-type peptidyl-prolyl cis-trans isomerase [Tsukamurella sp. PLM1]BDH58161.1 peptidyl-prolyl cis-trans isomerase [Tsukamurella sp. PLM1]